MGQTGRMAALALSLAFVVTAITWAQGDTSGRVSIEAETIAVGIGATRGTGTLTYQGKEYAFTVKGVSLLDIGVSKVQAKGEVADLKKVEDFEGTYASVAAGGAMGSGAGAAVLTNQNGVKMVLTATGEGVRFTTAKGGLEITLKK